MIHGYPLSLLSGGQAVQCHVNSKLMVLLCLDGLQLYIFTMMFVKSFTTLCVVQVEMVNNSTHCNDHIIKRMRTKWIDRDLNIEKHIHPYHIRALS